MINDGIDPSIFGQRWRRCTLRLVRGETVSTTHPDYLSMPTARNWVLWAKPEGKGLQFVPTARIAAVELETYPVSA
jgi:L-rhamnose isomerase